VSCRLLVNRSGFVSGQFSHSVTLQEIKINCWEQASLSGHSQLCHCCEQDIFESLAPYISPGEAVQGRESLQTEPAEAAESVENYHEEEWVCTSTLWSYCTRGRSRGLYSTRWSWVPYLTWDPALSAVNPILLYM